jgi:hypothetical protein
VSAVFKSTIAAVDSVLQGPNQRRGAVYEIETAKDPDGRTDGYGREILLDEWQEMLAKDIVTVLNHFQARDTLEIGRMMESIIFNVADRLMTAREEDES